MAIVILCALIWHYTWFYPELEFQEQVAFTIYYIAYIVVFPLILIKEFFKIETIRLKGYIISPRFISLFILLSFLSAAMMSYALIDGPDVLAMGTPLFLFLFSAWQLYKYFLSIPPIREKTFIRFLSYVQKLRRVFRESKRLKRRNI